MRWCFISKIVSVLKLHAIYTHFPFVMVAIVDYYTLYKGQHLRVRVRGLRDLLA